MSHEDGIDGPWQCAARHAASATVSVARKSPRRRGSVAPRRDDTTTEDPRWDCVDIRALRPVARPVTLADVKAAPRLAEMSLVTSMRLSVQPVTEEEWRIVCEMAGIAP